MERIETFLRELPLFKTFSSTELKELIEKSQLKTYSPGEKIIRFGQPGGFLGIVLDGEAEAVVVRKIGDRKQLGLIQAGSLIGEMSLRTGVQIT